MLRFCLKSLGFGWFGQTQIVIAAVFALVLACACDDAEPGPPAAVVAPRAHFRAKGDFFEIDRGDSKGWQKFFINGVNLAIAKPGFFPGQLAATRQDYDRWFADISAMNTNLIRIYTLHYPVFYQALRDWNLAHADHPLYVMHGIWLDEIESGDYITDTTKEFDLEIQRVVDACHGNAIIDKRAGKAYGTFDADISAWVMAFLPGHEMDGFLVQNAQDKYAAYDQYNGKYLRMGKGLAIEGWVARTLDSVVEYDHDKYGDWRPVAWSNWPALDPIHHVTETINFGQDVIDCDFGKYEMLAPYDAGVFVSYHVYPFNPEFIIYGPTYTAVKDKSGKFNSYLGYMLDLKAHHKGVPLVIAEFGIPSSFGAAHVNTNAYDHGGYNESEQADIVVDEYRALVQAGAAGAIVFEWIDEWFKRTWTCTPTMLPGDRGPLWYDVMSPEESFGIISYYPINGISKIIDGKANDWTSKDFSIGQQSGPPLHPTGDGDDGRRTLLGGWVASDPAYLFIRLQLDSKAAAKLDDLVVLVGLSTAEGNTGDHSIESLDLKTQTELGFESLLVLDAGAQSFQLLTDDQYDPMPRINGGVKAGAMPLPNDNGKFQLGVQMVNNNTQYLTSGIEIDGQPFLPEKKTFSWGKLRYGSQNTDTLAHVFAGDEGVIEVRLPWHALWVTDPSSRQILWNSASLPTGFSSQATAGARLLAVVAQRLPDGKLKLIDALPRSAISGNTVSATALPLFAWPTWEELPDVAERKKPLYTKLKTLFAEVHP